MTGIRNRARGVRDYRLGPWEGLALMLAAATMPACDAPPSPASTAEWPAPYPPSTVIGGISLEWTTHERRAPGSDNWPVTWADDGHQYTTWGDGGGFGGNNSTGRVSLGIARIEGGAERYTGGNVNGGVSPESGNSTLSGKSYGLVALEGRLYMWISPGSDRFNWDSVQLFGSTDRGATWAALPPLWNESDGVGIPGILQFGRGYSGARDDHVYSYFINIKDPSALDVQKPGELVLARVPANEVEHASAYEWVVGLDPDGSARWSPNVEDRVPVFRDPNGVGWTVSAIHHPGLDRYLLITEHGRSFEGNVGIFDGPEPWGPWTTVEYQSKWPSGGEVEHSAFYWNFSAKWWGEGDDDFVLVFSGIKENDSWNRVRGSFMPPRPDTARAKAAAGTAD